MGVGVGAGDRKAVARTPLVPGWPGLPRKSLAYRQVPILSPGGLRFGARVGRGVRQAPPKAPESN